ncbi:TIGR03767 family metallophosphoesterase [Streptomyces sp. XM4193]|uniref:TIGR03767 family metallophosphoesterase n=1 Tax=Streptomyces sp. XM4193 TaxID=2929782 RepID=UPI001FFAE116|nr:TIGR03767 family metallophosphoesterase [Streptomyces sp. XM4193]MCK1795823.1 TIGR03767 family metallophosphoesterase [Streptomyces sp. XM4193]
MPRSQNSPEPLNRRTLLTAGAAVAATATGAIHLLRSRDAVASGAPADVPASPASAAPQRSTPARPAPIAPTPAGTTLESVAVADGARQDGSYRKLTEGPGWAREVREELAPAVGGREERRRTLGAFVQFTDLHIVDTQHPLRHEYLRAETASAWRPQETLSVHGTLSLIDRVNALRHGPATGAPLACVVTTGDNTDNNSRAELDWYLTAMSGGRITPNTGDPRGYEGVQNSGLPLYWHPESTLRDADKKLGYPRVDGLLTAATRRLTSPGLNIPWYSTVGNHDTLPGGCYASGDSFFADLAVGDRKLMELPREVSATLWRRVREGGDPRGEQFTALLKEYARNARTVTPDPARAPFTPAEYVRAHLRSRYTGAGPRGHGYTEANLAEDRLYYTFRISDDLVGISLDTTRPGGHYTGAVGAAQLRWLERELRAHRDTPALVFSHHTSASTPDGGDQLLEVLGRHPNVLAWINGHSHKNAVTAHRGFWEVSTASHVDFPQLARVVEVTDNRDGSYSLFTTLIESAAPAGSATGSFDRVELASLYRELAHNAPGARRTLAGGATDRNTELLVRRDG